MGAGNGRHAFEALKRGARVVAFDYLVADLIEARDLMQAMVTEGEAPDGRPRSRRRTATPSSCRSPTTPSTASSPPRCSSTCPTTSGPWTSWPGCSSPADAWPPPSRPGCPRRSAGRSPTSTTPPSSKAATSASTPSPRCAGSSGPPASSRATPTTPTPCTRPTGGSGARSAPTTTITRWCKAYHRLLVWDMVDNPWITRLAEKILQPVLGKSLVVYADKAARPPVGVGPDPSVRRPPTPICSREPTDAAA